MSKEDAPAAELSMADWERRAVPAAMRLQAASEELVSVFAQVAGQVQQAAAIADDSATRRELRPHMLSNVEELLDRLSTRGPDALSLREQKALVGTPTRLSASHLDALLTASPVLVRHAGRVCLVHWASYLRDAWGSAYEQTVCRRADRATRLFATELPVQTLLSRSHPRGDESVAAHLPTLGIRDAYEHLKSRLGVRDSWMFSSSVLVAWLSARASSKTFLDGTFLDILRHERLRALLLPAARAGSGGPPVRTSVEVQAQTVATALSCAFSRPPLLQQATTLNTLVDHLLKSTFDDPRSPLQTEGWMEVRRLNETGFRRLLTSLCEQDLEVFFQHAMNEPDRRAFWLRYLPEIERTGCVLDRDVRKRMNAKLQAVPELQGAIDRAHGFKNASDVQAFFLVFPSIVVVEFSHSGNAAYVYPREFFAKRLEPRIQKGMVETERSLKLQEHAVHRILHGGRWQGGASDWLAGQGIHARGR